MPGQEREEERAGERDAGRAPHLEDRVEDARGGAGVPPWTAGQDGVGKHRRDHPTHEKQRARALQPAPDLQGQID